MPRVPVHCLCSGNGPALLNCLVFSSCKSHTGTGNWQASPPPVRSGKDQYGRWDQRVTRAFQRSASRRFSRKNNNFQGARETVAVETVTCPRGHPELETRQADSEQRVPGASHEGAQGLLGISQAASRKGCVEWRQARWRQAAPLSPPAGSTGAMRRCRGALPPRASRTSRAASPSGTS